MTSRTLTEAEIGAALTWSRQQASAHLDTARAAIEEKSAPRAPVRTAAQLRADIARAALTIRPKAAEKRRATAKKNRQVRHYLRPDGMASIEATLDAEAAVTIHTTLNLLADAARDAAARSENPDHRTHDQRLTSPSRCSCPIPGGTGTEHW